MLAIDDLKVALDADAGLVRAIDGLSLSVRRGETVALVGESGCGKSMTALALMRLLPDNGGVTNGGIDLEGQDLLALPESSMRAVRGARIGMIFQEPGTSLNPVLRVGDQIVEAIRAHTGLRGAAARAKALEWLDRVGIDEPGRRIDEYPFRLSGGQKQRVMIAMALACEPDFLIADEPTTALDVTIQAQILELLMQLQREQGMGLLLITHDLAVVAQMAHRVALMYAGQIVEVADAQVFFAAPRHPYARLLLRALPDAARRTDTLAAIPGMVPALSQSFEGCRFAPRCDRVFDPCRHTTPELIAADSSAVRCLLYRDGRAPEAAATRAAAVASAPLVVDAPDPPAARRNLLEVSHLSVRFPIRAGLLRRSVGSFAAVDDVSFAIGHGRTLAMVGESGCGKTTTGKAIVQLLRGQAAIDGAAWFDDLDDVPDDPGGASSRVPDAPAPPDGPGPGMHDLFTLDGAALRAARRRIQIIFQDPFASLNPRMRVREILDEGLQALRGDLTPASRLASLERMVDRVGLERGALQRYPHEFSGGQRQRIAIARALALQPRLIVCDEPTSALDVSVQAQILNLLRELQRELGVSYLFITHNIGVVEYIADEVAVMHRGRIEEAGPAGTVLASPRSAYTRALLDAVPRIGSRPPR